MNDTETEARRLLATAADDRPPGIDLLGGFAGAHRRERARRMRGRAVLTAGVAVAASATAAVLTIGSAPSALATVTGALNRTLTQSYHLTAQESSYYIWNGQIKYRSHDTCTGEADPARHLYSSSCSNGLRVREVAGYEYIYIAGPAGHPGKHWQRIAIASVVHLPAINGFTSATSQQMLSEIKKAEKVTVAGRASGPGWTGTRYAFSGSPDAADKVSGTVDVDQQGRTRAVFVTTRMTSAINVFVMTEVLTFSDFGTPVTVTPPPPDQTTSGP